MVGQLPMSQLILDVLVLQVAGGKDTVRIVVGNRLMSVHHSSSQLPSIHRRPTSHSTNQATERYSTSTPGSA